jgi:type I restriction enzyme M protein
MTLFSQRLEPPQNPGRFNLLFFTKGKKTEKTWYYDLSYVKVGKKTPLTLAHFGFDQNGEVLADTQLPAILTGDWHTDEANADKPFPSYAYMLKHRGKPEGDSCYSWTVDFAARRATARAEMQPLLDEAENIKAIVVDLKERFKRLKKGKASDVELEALDTQIKEKDKAVRDLEIKAADIDAAVFDLKAVNPTVVFDMDTRKPQQIIQNIETQGRIIAEALSRLDTLLQQGL